MGASLSRYTNSIQSVRAIIALQAITGNLSGSGKGMMNVQGGKPGGGEAFEEHFRSPDLATCFELQKNPVQYGAQQGQGSSAEFKLQALFGCQPGSERPSAKSILSSTGDSSWTRRRQLAHLIIPATMVFESSGSQYGNQRQVVWREKAIPSLGETVEDWRFYRDLGKRITKDTFPPIEKVEDIYELFRKYAPTWAGLTLDRLKKDPTGISWPCPSADHPGTKGTLYPDNRFLNS